MVKIVLLVVVKVLSTHTLIIVIVLYRIVFVEKI